MKKVVSSLLIVLILLIFGFNIYNSKREYYKEQVEFYNKNFSGVVKDICEGRGTKIYYSSNEYFYTFFCEDEYKLDENVKVGDIVIKEFETLEICRNKRDNVIISSNVMKPEKSYFEFFFGL